MCCTPSRVMYSRLVRYPLPLSLFLFLSLLSLSRAGGALHIAASAWSGTHTHVCVHAEFMHYNQTFEEYRLHIARMRDARRCHLYSRNANAFAWETARRLAEFRYLHSWILPRGCATVEMQNNFFRNTCSRRSLNFCFLTTKNLLETDQIID